MWLDKDEPDKVIWLASLYGVVNYRNDFVGNAFSYVELMQLIQGRCNVVSRLHSRVESLRCRLKNLVKKKDGAVTEQ